MQVTVDRNAVFKLLDTILPLWQVRAYPYSRKEAVIPQTLIPKALRDDKRSLACFYFYTCIYMRGGIESKQAFNALLNMRKQHPEFFDPLLARLMDAGEVQVVLKNFIGWDSKAAAQNWVENSRRLAEYWDANPLKLVEGVRDYEEACRRIRSKLTRREIAAAGTRGRGFVGFQYKMVSMLLYFLDWEGLLQRRFLYPSPADFHNFRLGIASGAITIEATPGKMPRTTELLSAPWRAAVMEYLRQRKADPVEVADAIWLYSLVLCGNSPATTTKKEPLKRYKEKLAQETLLVVADEEEKWDPLERATHKLKALEQTCLVCPFANTCRPVPAQPYYTRGQLEIRKPLNLSATLYGAQVKAAPALSPVVHLHLFEPPAEAF